MIRHESDAVLGIDDALAAVGTGAHEDANNGPMTPYPQLHAIGILADEGSLHIIVMSTSKIAAL